MKTYDVPLFQLILDHVGGNNIKYVTLFINKVSTTLMFCELDLNLV